MYTYECRQRARGMMDTTTDVAQGSIGRVEDGSGGNRGCDLTAHTCVCGACLDVAAALSIGWGVDEHGNAGRPQHLERARRLLPRLAIRLRSGHRFGLVVFTRAHGSEADASVSQGRKGRKEASQRVAGWVVPFFLCCFALLRLD